MSNISTIIMKYMRHRLLYYFVKKFENRESF